MVKWTTAVRAVAHALDRRIGRCALLCGFFGSVCFAAVVARDDVGPDGLSSQVLKYPWWDVLRWASLCGPAPFVMLPGILLRPTLSAIVRSLVAFPVGWLIYGLCVAVARPHSSWFGAYGSAAAIGCGGAGLIALLCVADVREHWYARIEAPFAAVFVVFVLGWALRALLPGAYGRYLAPWAMVMTIVGAPIMSLVMWLPLDDRLRQELGFPPPPAPETDDA